MGLQTNILNWNEATPIPRIEALTGLALLRLERGDAPASRATTHAMSVGDMFSAGWVWATPTGCASRCNPELCDHAGQSRRFRAGRPYLRVNGSGVEIARNDDGPGYNSQLTIKVTQPGTYYLQRPAASPVAPAATIRLAWCAIPYEVSSPWMRSPSG